MKIVIDTNRIMASIIRDHTTRKILFSDMFDFITPEHAINEITVYKNELMKKAMLNGPEFDLVLANIIDCIDVVPGIYFDKLMKQSDTIIADKGDVPFIALCMAMKADGIWTHDKEFMKQTKVKIFSNADMINLM